MKKLYFLSPTLSVCLSFLMSSCLTTGGTGIVPNKNVSNFDYTPAETKPPGSAKMSIAVIDPAYNKAFAYSSFEMFQRFGNLLEADIQEVLVAHGYSLKGPFISTDEMVITDKRDADLAILIEINPEVISNGGWKPIYNVIYKDYTYMYSGNLSVLGKINLIAVEPLTGERVWVKSIEIPVRDVYVATYKKYGKDEFSTEILKDVGIYNPLGESMLKAYKGILYKIDAHVSPAEFEGLRPIIKELKAKKGY